MLFVTPVWSTMVPCQWCGQCLCSEHAALSLLGVLWTFTGLCQFPSRGAAQQCPWECAAAAAEHSPKMDGADGAQNAAG